LDKEEPPTPVEISRYNRALTIAQQPASVFQHIKDGTLQASDIEDLHNMYPNVYQHMQQIVTNEMMAAKGAGTTIPYKTRIGLSLFLGHPVDASMTPQAIQAAQPQSTQQPSSAGKPKPAKVSEKQAKSYQTSSQAAESDRGRRD